MKPIDFNINDHVLVRLTDHGREILRKNHDEFASQIKGLGALEYVPPKEDRGGWSRWQLWCLMAHLGESISMGHRELPFETTIRIDVNEDQNQP